MNVSYFTKKINSLATKTSNTTAGFQELGCRCDKSKRGFCWLLKNDFTTFNPFQPSALLSLKVTLLPEYFSRFLYCRNGTKSSKTS